MKNSFLSDSILYFLAKGLSGVFCLLPLSVSLWIGRRAGDLAFLFYRKRGEVAYRNLKSCLGETTDPVELRRIERKVFQNLMQTVVEIFRFPKLDKSYLDRYVSVHGLENLEAAKKKGRGLITLTAHFGNWELQSAASALWGYPLQVLAREQKFPKTNSLLNRYRELTGCRVIQKGMMTRDILRHLKANGRVGILTDQDAGKNGVFVNFFGRATSFAPGAIAFALKTGCDVTPCFIRRERHTFHVIEVTEPLRLTQTGDEAEDIRRGLQQFADRLEVYIRKYPDQWLWLHKRWKSSPSRKVAILSDGKAGHLSQSLGVASLLEKVLREEGKEIVSQDCLEIRFKKGWRRGVLTFLSLFSRRPSQKGLRWIQFALTEESYRKMGRSHYDFIISTGSSLAPLNRLLSLDHGARGIVVMDPVIPPPHFFDLAIIPEHDRPRRSPRIVTTKMAPHPLTPEGVMREATRLSEKIGPLEGDSLGLFIGGPTDEFAWQKEEFSRLIETTIQEAEKRKFHLLVTTSRRTSKELEHFLEEALKGKDLCKLLVLANQKNVDGVVPAILGLSRLVLVTGESISMVSEAVSVSKGVVVLLPARRKRHSKIEKALLALQEDQQIFMTEPEKLAKAIEEALKSGEKQRVIEDNLRIEEGLRRIL